MNELQSEGETAPEINQAPADNQANEAQADPIQESDLATENVESTTQTTDSADQDKINKVINKKHFEKMEAERRAEAAEAQLAEIEQKRLADMQANIGNIPEMPDPYDDDYESKLKGRDEAIRRNAEYQAQQNLVAQQQQAQQQQQQQQQMQELNTKVESYKQNAVKAGITAQELQEAGNTVAKYQLNDRATMAILGDNDGALITKYLAANPIEIDTLNRMNDFEAALHIERNVRAKAVALKPISSNVPPPPTDVNGNGADPESGKYEYLTGATFE